MVYHGDQGGVWLCTVVTKGVQGDAPYLLRACRDVRHDYKYYGVVERCAKITKWMQGGAL